MKHCGKCRQDYADKFETCFSCGGALAEGSIEPVAEAAHQRASEDAAAKAMVAVARTHGTDLALVVSALAAVVGFWFWANDPRLVVAERALAALEEGKVPGFAPAGGGAIRTELERARFQVDHGVALPAMETGREMLVWYPIESEVVYRRRSPEIEGVDDRGAWVEARVRASKHPPPAMLQLVERVMRELDAAAAELDPGLLVDPAELEGLDEAEVERRIEEAAARAARSVPGARPRASSSRPRIQLVAVARVPLRMGTVRFDVAKALTDPEEPFDAAAMGKQMAAELIFGFFSDLGGWLVFGLAGVVVFVWLTLKLGSRS